MNIPEYQNNFFVSQVIDQKNHLFKVGQAIFYDGYSYKLAKSDHEKYIPR